MPAFLCPFISDQLLGAASCSFSFWHFNPFWTLFQALGAGSTPHWLPALGPNFPVPSFEQRYALLFKNDSHFQPGQLPLFQPSLLDQVPLTCPLPFLYVGTPTRAATPLPYFWERCTHHSSSISVWPLMPPARPSPSPGHRPASTGPLDLSPKMGHFWPWCKPERSGLFYGGQL